MATSPSAMHDSADGEDVSLLSTDAKSQGKRTSRACLVCRARKSKCTLDSQDGTPHPPCRRCKREGKECVIGSSNRGGRRIRKSTILAQQPQRPDGLQSRDQSQQMDLAADDGRPNNPVAYHRPDTTPTFSVVTASKHPSADPRGSVTGVNGDLPMAPESGLQSRDPTDDMSFNDLQNPSDALDILAHIASNGGSRDGKAWPGRRSNSNSFKYQSYSSQMPDYPPLSAGVLTLDKLFSLLRRYHQHYHPYYPIVPLQTLEPTNVPSTIANEPHLLTAILVISSKDLTDEPHIFNSCSKHMQELVSALAAGGSGEVEAVEALLLLAEWTPYTSHRRAGSVGRGEEDREAWMHVGNALRIGYFLGLDRYSFRLQDSKDLQAQRKRLVWTACYISDRQISIRIGRAFWSRGPGPLTTLRKEDFPSLQPLLPHEDDYSNIFQATLELTMLFSNVHDVLYSNPSGFRSHLSGGYIKFIDDFRSAIYGWHSVYGTLTCSQHLKACLVMSYDYLRLYTNAFAFHATIQRALPKTEDGRPVFSRVFYNNVGAVGDARFIYEGLDAAKSLLTTMNNFVEADNLRYMPLRFYLYTIYAGVFLYRARTVGVMSPEEDTSVRRLVSQTVQKLEQASVGETHPGYRYSQLLKLLWDKVDKRSRKSEGSLATIVNPYRPGSFSSGQQQQQGQTPSVASGGIGDLASPGSTEKMGDFSWTDLNAIGNFAVNGNDGMNLGDDDWWATGFLPADKNSFGMPMDMAFGADQWNFGL